MEPERARLRAAAAQGAMDIDRPVYEAAGRDPLEPVLLGSGSLGARVGVFGRDPGRQEILLGEPFIGKGGQLIRQALVAAAGGAVPASIEQGIEVGRQIFWCNTVPYKPTGNKAWSVAVKRRFAPVIADLIVRRWSGVDLITCGNVAFEWFGLVDRSLKPALAAFWRREDRYRASLEIELQGKRLRLHPLPHPSPLNARWYRHFPELMAARLDALGWP